MRDVSSFVIKHLVEAILGGVWVGFLWLFIMFYYQYNYVYYQKGIIEDNAAFKSDYKELQKVSRKIALGFVIFLIISGCLLYEEELEFVYSIGKGCCLAALVGPAMNYHYGDK